MRIDFDLVLARIGQARDDPHPWDLTVVTYRRVHSLSQVHGVTCRLIESHPSFRNPRELVTSSSEGRGIGHKSHADKRPVFFRYHKVVRVGHDLDTPD